MAKQYSRDFRSRKSFEKTYSRYKRDYYKKAKQIWKRLHRIPAKQGVRVTHKELETMMYDDKVLSKREFAAEYKKVKRDLQAQDSTADPTQYIVSSQAYEYSEAQYRAFVKAKERDEFAFMRGISREEFRTGSFRTMEFYSKIKEIYRQRKDDYRNAGFMEDELASMAAQDISLYFGSE